MAYVRIDLDEIDTDDLIEELEYRGYKVQEKIEADEFADIDQYGLLDDIGKIYQLKRTGQSYDKQLDDVIHKVIGRL
jgi:broad-specificity NMP kinase